MNHPLRFLPSAACVFSTVVLALGLSACTPLLVGGAFFGTVKVATDRRTAETQVVDEAIELRSFGRLREHLGGRGRVDVSSYGRRVLLVGEVPTEQDKVVAERAVASVDNVLRVINDLQVMPTVPLKDRSEDGLITARVQTSLIEAKDLTAGAVKILTNRGTVYVRGVLTEREATRVVNIARTVKGTQKVVNMVDLISEAELARLQTSGVRDVPTGPTTSTPAAPAATEPSVPGALASPPIQIPPGQPL